MDLNTAEKPRKLLPPVEDPAANILYSSTKPKRYRIRVKSQLKKGRRSLMEIDDCRFVTPAVYLTWIV